MHNVIRWDKLFPGVYNLLCGICVWFIEPSLQGQCTNWTTSVFPVTNYHSVWSVIVMMLFSVPSHDMISSTKRDKLYHLDMELHLLRNLTWETDNSLLFMCSDITVSAMRVYPYLGYTLYSVVSVQREVGLIYWNVLFQSQWYNTIYSRKVLAHVACIYIV